MSTVPRERRAAALVLGTPLLVLLALPLVALLIGSSPADILAGVREPMFGSALRLSLASSALSLVAIIGFGTPLAWWLAGPASRTRSIVESVLSVPIVLPPAVVGIALLQTFGRSGLLGPIFDGLGVRIPFTTVAVVIAQVVVAAPFYVRAASDAFRSLDPDLMHAARSLGQDGRGALLRVAIPVALPALVTGASLSWARALGEFGATLLFAGNQTGITQTMPLAIYSAMEADIRVAVALSIVLAAVAVFVLTVGSAISPLRLRAST